MKLAVLMTLSSPWSREAAARLANCGHQVHVIDFCVRDPEAYLSCQDVFQAGDIQKFRRSVADVHILQSRFSSHLRYVTAARALNRTLRRIGADLLVTFYGGGFATIAYLSGFRPYVVYVVGSDVLLGGRAKRILASIALASARAVFVNGQYLSTMTKKLTGDTNTECLYLGTDTEMFTPDSAQTSPIRIVCTRGFSTVYNNEYLIRALAEMPSLPQAYDYEVVFTSLGPLLERVRALADEVLPIECRRKVKFLGGVDRGQIRNTLRESHIFVSLSRSDGASISLMEGLSCGLFPILSDIPANREWISADGKNGTLVPLDQPEVLASALIRAISNDELRAQAANYNRRMILERADSRKNMIFLAAQLEQLTLANGMQGTDLVHTADQPIRTLGGGLE